MSSYFFCSCTDKERVQKATLGIIFFEIHIYGNYLNALGMSVLENLDDIGDNLCLKFANRPLNTMSSNIGFSYSQHFQQDSTKLNTLNL